MQVCLRIWSSSVGESAENDEGAKLLAQFMQYVDASQQSWPLEGRNPSHLMPPTTVVRVQVSTVNVCFWLSCMVYQLTEGDLTAASSCFVLLSRQMDALMRNDWPEEDSGIKTAFAFAMPARADEMLAGQVTEPRVALTTVVDIGLHSLR